MHKASIKLQNRYHFAMAISVSSIFVGFVSLAGSVALSHENTQAAEFLSLMDAWSFLLAFASFLIGSHAGRRWIDSRIKTELMRQWGNVSV